MRWFPPRSPLSPHFTWAEVIRNSGYDRVPLGPLVIAGVGIVTPRRNARKQAQAMERVRIRVNGIRRAHNLKDTGINVLSWARSKQHNAQVGGASNSQHIHFDACDVSVQEIDRLLPLNGGRAIFDAILEQEFADGGVGLYVPGNRHMDTRGTRARWTVA